MPSIVTNLASMTAQRNLGATQNAFHRSVTRLSSGLRINSAADDAAGLFLSKKLEAQVRGLQQASRNAQDGMSLVQTAEGALNVTHSMLLRMRELAVQSANGVLSSADRLAIADEVETLTDEITRLAQTTSFNGMKLLDGTNGGAQVTGVGTGGVGSNAAIVDSAGTVIDGQAAINPTTAAAAISDGDELVAANGILSIVARSASATQPTAYRIYSSTDYDNTTDSVTLQLQVANQGTGAFTDVGSAVTVTGVSQITGAKLVSFEGTDIDVFVSSDLTVGTDATAGMLNSTNGILAATDNHFVVSNNLARMDVNTTVAGIDSTSSLDPGLTGVVLQVGANNVASDQLTLLNMNAMTAEGLGLVSSSAAGMGSYSIANNVTTQSGAQNAIDIIDNAIEMVSQQRSKIGAFQNRMEYTITNLGVAAENQAAANSRIVDADVAFEVSNMVKTQILSQSAMAVLAQANAAPQALLSLLS